MTAIDKCVQRISWARQLINQYFPDLIIGPVDGTCAL